MFSRIPGYVLGNKRIEPHTTAGSSKVSLKIFVKVFKRPIYRFFWIPHNVHTKFKKNDLFA
jgi:hypothetical protein